jgi:soluble lytic murein transglycosylase
MRVFQKKYVLTLMLLLLFASILYNSNWVGKLMYPIKYREAIDASAVKYGIDPYLIAAIIHVESNFKPELVSKKGAIGLMQLMPDTAKWILAMDGFSSLNMQSLHDPQANIMIGAKYIDLLNHQFNHNLVQVLAAYNAGPGNVSKWLDAGTWNGKLENIDQIHFWETRKYVDRVVYYYKKYQKTYALTKS